MIVDMYIISPKKDQFKPIFFNFFASPRIGLSNTNYNLNVMHLMERLRYVNSTKGNFVTNDTHNGMPEMLCQIILGLTILSKLCSESCILLIESLLTVYAEVYKNTIISLCGMVAYHIVYTTQDQKP